MAPSSNNLYSMFETRTAQKMLTHVASEAYFLSS